MQVRFEPPFTYASGLKGPFYCDNRKLLSDHRAREVVTDAFVHLIQKKFPEAQAILALATGGIPIGMLVADRLQKPFGYVRAKAKEHGAGNLIEGGDFSSKKVVLIEDLVNQGSSLDKALTSLESENILTLSCLCIVSYETDQASSISQKHQVPIYSLASAKEIAHYALSQNLISSVEKESFDQWLSSPSSWSPKDT